MENTKKAKWLGMLGIALCGLCCALPIITGGIGMASLAIVGLYLEKIGLTVLELALVILLFTWNKRRTKRIKCQTNSCSIDCECRKESLVNKANQ